jgi:hypothetical protein
MSLLIAVVVAFGFSQTIDMNLIHPSIPRPFLLYVHAAVFTGWLVFFILQSALVRTSNVRIHRAVGAFGNCDGCWNTGAGLLNPSRPNFKRCLADKPSFFH